MVTLLLTFFVLLFAMSSISEEKWKMLVEAFTGPEEIAQVQIVDTTEESIDIEGMQDPSGSGHSVTEDVPESPDQIASLEDLYEYLNAYVVEHDLQSDVQLYNGDGYTFLTFRNDILFDGNSSYLKQEGKVILDVLTEALVNVTDQIGAIRCEGHTARAGTTYSDVQSLFDRQLSSDRAVNVLYYMQCKKVISPEKLTSTGHGEFKPLVPHDGTEETRIINRRVEIIIVENDSTGKSLDDIYKEIYGE
jgi:chemotaxis protein MotB